MLTIIYSAGYDLQANLAYEEALFNDLRAAPRPALLFYVNNPCVVLGRSNPEAQWVDMAACAADSVPVLRRFSGGGTVYHDRDNLNYSLMVPRKLLGSTGGMSVHRYIDFFRALVIRALGRGSDGYSMAGISDICLNGAKVSGNAQRIAAGMVLHHGTVMLRCPVEAIERYLPVPPNRPGIPHRGFVTGLHEQGRMHTMEQIKGWIAEEFTETLRLR